MAGPLAGMRIVELAGKGPGPFCGMMLADHGAQVLRIERPGTTPHSSDPLLRSREFLAVNLKLPAGVAVVRDLVRSAQGLIEGYRPGVMERLGLGPKSLLADNPKLVYGRMTGWGQTGPYASVAGHDINYVALSGTLHGLGSVGGKPTPPSNLLGDFGGGGMLLAFGMVSAMLAVARGGGGQVIDCAMTEGAALLNSMTWGFFAAGSWRDERGVNLLDGGAHFYDTYACSDGKFLSVGTLEQAFYKVFLEKMGLAGDLRFANQFDRTQWAALKRVLTEKFLTRTRDQWCGLFENSEACVVPVLSLEEAPNHPHNRERQSFIELAGVIQPAPAPRYSETALDEPRVAKHASEQANAWLAEVGYVERDIARLREQGVLQ